MKKIIGLLTFLFICVAVNAAEKETIKSTVTDVTVYTQGAQIFRKANYTVKPGVTQLIIEGVSPNIDPKSLQVKAQGNVILIDSKYSKYYPQPEPQKLEGLPLQIRKKISLLEDSLQVVNYDIQEIQEEMAVLQKAKNIIDNNGLVRGEGKVKDSIALLKSTVEYYTTKVTELNKKILALSKRLNRETEVRNGMQTRLNDLRNYQNSATPATPKGPIHQIVITVSAKEAAAGKITVSYLVSGASWVPSYDLRTDVTTGKVNLTYKASVSQNCGEEWEDVKLTVSTNNPYQNKTRPVLHPWYIDYYIARTESANYGAMAGYTNAAPAHITTDKKASYAEEDMMKDAESSLDFTTMIDRVLSAEFKIDLPYSIKSNGEQHMVLVKDMELNATFKHISVPKLDPGAFLVAQIVKLDELQLVPANANIFFDGTYIGETYLDPTTMDDTLSLSLGKDPNIIVRRTFLKGEMKEKLLSNNQKERIMTYEIEVKNLKSTPITINVKDQLPITQNAEIIIEAISLDKGVLNETTGIINWEMAVKPKENKKIRFTYKVKHDKDKNVVL